MTDRLPVPLDKAYRLMNHGPTVLVSSRHGEAVNVMAAAWSMPLDFQPPKVAVVLDKSTLTRRMIEASGEFALNVPSRELARLLPTALRKHSIRAPWGNAPELREKIADLRKAGEVVIQSMPGHDNIQDEFECDRVLVLENGNWILKNLG